MKFLIAYLRPFIRKTDGQDMIEYALLAALIAIVAVVTVQTAGDSIGAIWDEIAGDLSVAEDAAAQ
jgi:pilus assembly protein Flp/PilA